MFRQAIGHLVPPFQANPAAHHAAMSAMLKNYMERSEEVGLEPDVGLVQPILHLLVGLDHH